MRFYQMQVEEVLRLLVGVGLLDEKLNVSGEFHRRWRVYQIAVEKNPMALQKAKIDKIDIQGACVIPAIVSFFPQGLHEKDIEFVHNYVYEHLGEIPAIPYKA